ncbi:MAG: MATE family efflux transporter [Syntrophaceae bacterium]|nr:MATE family efflux transporter [Syntrophaceae bacterium]
MHHKLILDDQNIGKLLFKQSLPAIIGMFVMSLYNVVDAIFIGRVVGTLGIAGIAIAFPIQMIVGAIGQMFGIGGASLLSRSLGAKKFNLANKILGNVIATITLLSLSITILGYIYLDKLLILFGASETILPYAKEYMQIILSGIFMHSLAMSLNNLIRAEGKAKTAMTTMILSAVVNIIMDAVFIIGLKMGIKGAAIATIIAYFTSAVFLVSVYLRGRSLLQLRMREIRFDRYIQKEILAIGVSAFTRQAAMSILIILLNNTLGKYGGDMAIAVYGVVMRLVMLIFTPVMGIAQGLQPIAGYNYGARDYNNTKKSVKIAMVASTIISFAGTLLLMLFPKTFLGVFSNDNHLLSTGESALRYIVLAFPTVGFHVIGTTLFQAMGKATQTFILTVSRQFLFLIPLVFILSHFFQLTGVWISFPIADVLSVILTLFMLIQLQNQFKQEAQNNLEG